MDDDGTQSETSIMQDGVEMKDVVMLKAGLILKDIDDKATILALMPGFADKIKGEAPKDGDIIISLNGTKGLSSEEINTAYKKIKEGELITIVFDRDAKEFEISFKKQATPDNGEMIIRK